MSKSSKRRKPNRNQLSRRPESDGQSGQSASAVKPASVTNYGINFLALVAALTLLIVLQWHFPNRSIYNIAAACGLLVGLIALADLFILKVYRRESAGLVFGSGRASPARVAIKCLALVFTLGVVAFGYWLFPEYRGSFYDPFWHLLGVIGPWVLAAAIPYFWIIDAAQVEPRDSYWHLGKVLIGQARPDTRVLARHFGGWLVKGFFLPLMVVYLSQQVDIATRDIGHVLRVVDSPFLQWMSGFGVRALYDFGYNGIFLIDVMFAAIGYCLTLRIFDSHIRSVEPTGLGWGVALVCYQPFWSIISGQYLNYNDHYYWGNWFTQPPALALWGGLIIVLLAIYVSATIAFGLRFSNLTHRGILTNGPYRFTKHPAYISKNLAWWLISVPFVSTGNLTDALRASVLLGIVNVIYFLRAKTEERHLSRDPVYREYAAWIDEHGLFAVLGRWFARLNPIPPRIAARRTSGN